MRLLSSNNSTVLRSAGRFWSSCRELRHYLGLGCLVAESLGFSVSLSYVNPLLFVSTLAIKNEVVRIVHLSLKCSGHYFEKKGQNIKGSERSGLVAFSSATSPHPSRLSLSAPRKEAWGPIFRIPKRSYPFQMVTCLPVTYWHTLVQVPVYYFQADV